VLEGRDHIENCALCHMPNIGIIQNPKLAEADLDQECQICKSTSTTKGGRKMLLCDICNRGYHMQCLEPPVKKVPRGDWFCPRCASRLEQDLV
jgi:hypothetical protein